MWGEKAHYPGPHLWKCLVYMWSFPFTCSNLSLQVKVFNKTCEIVIFNMSEMSFACQMSSWRGKQITCANISFAHVICFPHMWNTANHMNACNPPDSVLPRVFCTWFVGDKSQSLIKKTFQFPWEIVIFFLSRVQRKVLHVGRFTVKEDPDFGLLLESVNGVAGSERERTYWEILSRRSGEYRRLDVGECPPQSFNTAYLRKP